MAMFEIRMGKVRNCEGMTRRDLLRVGSVGLFGLSLPGILALQARAAESETAKAASTDVNAILIWLDGGPSHIDMFDPKPEAPAEIRGEFGAIETSLSGVRISDQLPRLAKQMDKYSILRGATTPDASHGTGNHYLLTGWKFNPAITYPAYGSVYAREKSYRNGMPTYAIVGGVGQYTGGGYMGSVYNPFNVGGDPNSDSFSVKDVTPPAAVNADRISRRKGVLDAVDQFQRDAELAQRGVRTMDQFYSRAFDLVTSPVAKKAFDIKQEDAKLREKYGRNGFGQSCLLARRLIEAGTRFVQVNWPAVANGDPNVDAWDTHAANFGPLRNLHCPKLDSALSALLEDMDQRGMLKNTLVLAIGEFGRSPRLGVSTSGNGNAPDGRDHWPYCYTGLIAGAGIKRGVVYGKSDATGSTPVENPTHPTDILATVYHALGISPSTIIYNHLNQPRELVKGKPITALFG